MNRGEFNLETIGFSDEFKIFIGKYTIKMIKIIN